MKAIANILKQGSGRVISRVLPGRSSARTRRLAQRAFTLVELLAVMAIIGILAGVVAFAVTGLSATGLNAQIQSDTKNIEISADRFFNDSFPQTYPVVLLETDSDGKIIDLLVEDAGELGVRLVDFEARLPQDPNQTFTPDFIKEIPDSAALVSYRIDTNTGNVFAAADGTQLVLPANSRLDVSTGNRALETSNEAFLGDREPNEASDYTFKLRMRKNEAAVEILTVEIPAGYSLGGISEPEGTFMGKLNIEFSTDNPWDPGQVITLDADILKTGEANEWEIKVVYDINFSTGAGNDVNLKNREFAQPADDRFHTISLIAPTEDTPGKLTLVMDRITENPSDTDYTDPAHNEATETWKLVIFDHPEFPIGSELGGVNLLTNPSVDKVYRWLTEEHTSIDTDNVFERVSGNQAVVIKEEPDS